MSAALVVAGVILLTLVLYSLTGGADFGGGVWDLLARGPRAERQRALVADVIAPIWEANHVWLIIVVVLLFVCFPRANAVVATALHVPLTVMLLGVVMRGAAFVFRAYGPPHDASRRAWSRVFAVASTLTPVALGVTLGAVASGAIEVDPDTGRVVTDFVSEWAAPFPFALGLFTVGLFALVAATYLTLEAADPDLREDFRRRALGAAVFVGAMALVSALTARTGAPHVASGLLGEVWSLPFQLVTGLVAVAAIAALWTRRFRLARALVQAQVALIVLGWGFAQYPYLVPDVLTIEQAAAPDHVLVPVLAALGVGSVVLAPAFVYLYRVFGRGTTAAGRRERRDAHDSTRTD